MSQVSIQRRLSLISVLRHRGFFALWAGQLFSRLGDNIYNVGLMWLVLEMTGSKALMGLIGALEVLPTLFLGLFAGVIVDRFDRRRLMITADLIRGATVLVVPVLYYTDYLEVWHIGVVAVVLSTGTTFFTPARQAIIPHLVSLLDLTSANSLMQVTFQITGIIGPAIAGFLVGLTGTPHLFSLDGISFLISAMAILTIALPPHTSKEIKVIQTSLWDDLLKGVNFVRKHFMLSRLLLLLGLDCFIVGGPFVVGIPVFAKEVLWAGARGYGLLYSGYAAGRLICAMILGQAGDLPRKGCFALGGLALTGGAYILLGCSPTLILAIVAMTLAGAGSSLVDIPATTLIQQTISEEMLGRIFAMWNVLSDSGMILSMTIVGPLAEMVQVDSIFVGSGLLLLLCSAAGWSAKGLREG